MNYKYTMVLNFWLFAYSAISISMQSEQKAMQMVNADNDVEFSFWCPPPVCQEIGKYVLLIGTTVDFLSLRDTAKIFHSSTAMAVNTLTENELEQWWNIKNNRSFPEVAKLCDWFIRVGTCSKAPHMLAYYLKKRSTLENLALVASNIYIEKLCEWYKVTPDQKKDCVAKCTAISLVMDGLVSIKDSSTLGIIFHNAAYNGHHGLIELCIQKKVDVNISNSTKKTPLHKVVWRGDCVEDSNKYAQRKDIIAYLLDNGALINAQDSCKRTPLHVACEKRGMPLSIVQCFVERGSDLRLEDEGGLTPLETAKKYKLDSTVISYLVDKVMNNAKQV